MRDTNPRSILAATFGVLVRPRSYAQAFYSLIAFPLGTLYFCFLAVGLSLGLGLVIVWVGLLLLAFVLVASWGLAAFERQQAILLLGAEVPVRVVSVPDEGDDFWLATKRFLKNPVTWKGPCFLFLKFPLGVFSFIVALTGFALGLALLLAPLYYHWSPPQIGFWYVDSLSEALLVSGLGVLALTAALHLTDALAWIWRQLAERLLGHGSPSAPAADEALLEA